MAICAGNLCRSPFAAAYIERRLQDAGIYLDIYSRGLLALPGRRVPQEAQQAAAGFDIDLSKHIAQPLLAPDVERAGLILVMEPDQRTHITETRSSSVGKVFLLSYASDPEADTTIEDPMGKGVDDFRETYEKIVRHTDAWIKHFGIKTQTQHSRNQTGKD